MTFSHGKVPYVEVQSMTYVELANYEYSRIETSKEKSGIPVQVKVCSKVYGFDVQSAFDMGRENSEAIYDVYFYGYSFVPNPAVSDCDTLTGWRK